MVGRTRAARVFGAGRGMGGSVGGGIKIERREPKGPGLVKPNKLKVDQITASEDTNFLRGLNAA